MLRLPGQTEGTVGMGRDRWKKNGQASGGSLDFFKKETIFQKSESRAGNLNILKKRGVGGCGMNIITCVLVAFRLPICLF